MQVLPHLQAFVRICLPSPASSRGCTRVCSYPSLSLPPTPLSLKEILGSHALPFSEAWARPLSALLLPYHHQIRQIPCPSKPRLGSLSSRKPSLTYRCSMPFLRFHRPDFSFPDLTTPLWPVSTSVSPSLKSTWRLRVGLNFPP